jgi:hypothetical protein
MDIAGICRKMLHLPPPEKNDSPCTADAVPITTRSASTPPSFRSLCCGAMQLLGILFSLPPRSGKKVTRG